MGRLDIKGAIKPSIVALVGPTDRQAPLIRIDPAIAYPDIYNDTGNIGTINYLGRGGSARSIVK